jgi:putative DNA modification/repair radical SAM protein
MELRRKLAILADAAKYDASCASSGSRGRDSRGGRGIGSVDGTGICHAYTPDGRCVSLLKLLLTNHCAYDCLYCVNRASSDVPRAAFTVREVVDLTLDFYARNYVEGLFLSSGISGGPDRTMERLVRVARTLREEHDFRGYVHLKTIPETDPLLIAQAGRYADRLSCNVETPREAGLARLAPQKSLAAIRRTMAATRLRLEAARGEGRPGSFAPAGQSTQMVVGADGADDREALARAAELYGSYGLRRVYYSAFSPIPGAPAALPSRAPPLMREHRLYQADWLQRLYGFSLAEVLEGAGPDGMLDLEVDPKLAWALRNRGRFPLDVDRASREELLRVPGLGRRNVERLLQARRHGAVRYADLARLRVQLRRASPFLATVDHRPRAAALDGADLRRRLAAPPPPRQLELALPEHARA